MLSFSLPKTAALVDLESSVHYNLSRALEAYGCRAAAGTAQPDLIFCAHSSPRLAGLIRRASAPVVVVGRDDGAPAWLDALETGAADYLCAPFERIQVRWVLETLLGLNVAAA
jgi:DNA-binding response OmpR family regulator